MEGAKIITHKNKIPIVSTDNILRADQRKFRVSFVNSNSFQATNVDVDSSDKSYWQPWYDLGGTSQLKTHVLSAGGSTLSTVDHSLWVVGTNVMRLDSSDNLYVCGLSGESSGPLLAKKYNSSGVLQWTATYSNTYILGSSLSLTIDNSQNLYLAGGLTGGASVRKFNSSGATVSSYNSGGDVVGICSDNNYLYMSTGSNVIRTNFNFGSASTFTGAGSALWVDVDNFGNVYALEQQSLNKFIRKYNSSGTTIFRSQIASNSGLALQYNMVVDRNTGKIYTSIGTSEVLVIDTVGNITNRIDVSEYGQVWGLKLKGNTIYVSAGTYFIKFLIYE